MANNKNLRPPRFMKGKSGNPKGRPVGIKTALKKLTKESLEDVANLVIERKIKELRALVKSKTEPVLKVWIASIAMKAIDKGDMDSLDKLLNRLIGKVRDETHHTGDLPNAPQVIITLPSNGREIK